MQTLLSKALVASVTVAGFGLVAAPQAQAALFGGFGLTGTVNLFPPASPPVTPATVTGTFGAQFLDQASGPFVGSTLVSTTNPIVFTFAGTEGNFNLYTLTAFEVNLSGVDGFAGGYTLTAMPVAGEYVRVANGLASSIVSVVSLDAEDNQGNMYSGSISLNETLSADGTFAISFTSTDVPEPLTMLGASAAVAFGAAFKRRNANKG